MVLTLAIVATRAALNAPPVIAPEGAMPVFVPKPPEPPAQGFQTVVAPSDVPKVIRPVDLNQRPRDL